MSVPVNRFRQWLALARNAEDSAEACYLSTIGLDGWPNAHYVALKDVTRRGFVVAAHSIHEKGRSCSAYREPL